MPFLLIATRNAHKVREISQILGDRFHYLTLNDFPGAPEVVEDATTFEGNARKKSTELAQWLAQNPADLFSVAGRENNPFYVLADDSGLEVDALNGRPGVHSARFAAKDTHSGNSPDAANNAKLLRLLEHTDKRTARFRCVIALTVLEISSEKQTVSVSPQIRIASGACEGRIDRAPSGKGGFGYDPLFVPDGFSTTFAELGEEVKNKLSHRARALEKIKALLSFPA